MLSGHNQVSIADATPACSSITRCRYTHSRAKVITSLVLHWPVHMAPVRALRYIITKTHLHTPAQLVSPVSCKLIVDFAGLAHAGVMQASECHAGQKQFNETCIPCDCVQRCASSTPPQDASQYNTSLATHRHHLLHEVSTLDSSGTNCARGRRDVSWY